MLNQVDDPMLRFLDFSMRVYQNPYDSSHAPISRSKFQHFGVSL